MQIGNYKLHEIHAGTLRLDGGAMFGIIPRPLWERRTEPDSRGRITLAMRCLLLEGNGRLILIDNGVGDKYDEKFADIYAVDQESSELHRSLHSAGFDAADVTDVILTHLHFDHCGGSTRRDAGGHLKTAFPAAAFHVQKRHWEWAHESPREQASFLPENLRPLEESGQLVLQDGPGELFPGIETIVVDGHTRGQQLVRIGDEGRSLLFAADLLPTLAHVPLLWIMAYDVAPLDTLDEKKQLLDRAASEGWLIFLEHDPGVALAEIERSDRGFAGRELEKSLS